MSEPIAIASASLLNTEFTALVAESATTFEDSLLVDSQWTRCAVYHVLGHYIYPRLSTFSPEGDVFREKMAYYRQEYRTEFDKILRVGVKYDFDSSGDISVGEDKPTHFNRLVR